MPKRPEKVKLWEAAILWILVGSYSCISAVDVLGNDLLGSNLAKKYLYSFDLKT